MNYNEFKEYAYYKIKLKDIYSIGIRMYLRGELVMTDKELLEFLKKYAKMHYDYIDGYRP